MFLSILYCTHLWLSFFFCFDFWSMLELRWHNLKEENKIILVSNYQWLNETESVREKRYENWVQFNWDHDSRYMFATYYCRNIDMCDRYTRCQPANLRQRDNLFQLHCEKSRKENQRDTLIARRTVCTVYFNMCGKVCWISFFSTDDCHWDDWSVERQRNIQVETDYYY